MAIPEQLQNKVILDTLWRRRVGKHKNQPVKITSYNGACAIVELINIRGWQGHSSQIKKANINWDMFLRLYEPITELETKMDVTVDRNGLVEKVVNATYLEPKPPAPVFRVCHGPSHSPRNAHVDISKFSYTEREYVGGKRLHTECDDCLRYRRNSIEKTKTKQVIVPLAVTEVRTEEPQQVSVESPIHKEVSKADKEVGFTKWRVVVIEQVTHELEAANYLDAAVQFDRPGVEIVKIERL